ncbi:carboxypeptidase N subunit 2-like [Bradysia coprophila]|uniref:carboxypeptidase N subunit 2-like n=1 Tax=Bradysia coprophila TaxID=38358 RepID=UPI00187DB4B0|nr:carboxypeptidase N subunit 2-like [Bradysia coprophila]
MKLLFILSSFIAVTVAQQSLLHCTYIHYYDFNYDSIYACQLIINNPEGFNNITDIDGIHLDGFTNADVNFISRRDGSTANIPQIICDTFPNIEHLQLNNAGIITIDNSAFSGCSRVRRIDLHYNRITSISENAFVNLPEVSSISLGDNLLATLPENVFANQSNLTELVLDYNSFEYLPAGLFRPLKNLKSLFLGYANLTTINNQWFSANSTLNFLNLSGNRLILSPGIFAGLETLSGISLGDNGINEIPAGVFAGFTNLQSLSLASNNFTVLQADSFPDLGHLTDLLLSSNPIREIEDNAFRGLEGLLMLFVGNCRIRELNANSFENLRNLTYLELGRNEFEDILPGTFASMPNLYYIGLWSNRLKMLRRNVFGALTELQTLDLDMNNMNALDRAIINDAVNLNTLLFSRNLCASNYFGNFLMNRAEYLLMLDRCFANMRYFVDTTTESDGVYSFFDAHNAGITLRVQSDNEIQIALTSVNFLWTPAIEIFIGSTNNTQSVIRVNEETEVVAVPTPNILRPNQWNDFRVTWADQNVLVFSSNDTFPFMNYTMQDIFPVNFYGLRAVETRATWRIQPLQ